MRKVVCIVAWLAVAYLIHQNIWLRNEIVRLKNERNIDVSIRDCLIKDLYKKLK